MSLISEKWQPACLAGNLKSIRYKRALTSPLVKFSLKKSYFHFYTPAPRRGRGVYCLSVCPSKIFFVAFFSANIDGRNLIFGHKLHIGMPYCG
jgi:hypothetical protein